MASDEYFQRKVQDQKYGNGSNDFDLNLTHEQRQQLNVIRAYNPTKTNNNFSPANDDDTGGGMAIIVIILIGLSIYVVSEIASFIDRSPKSLLIFLSCNIIAFTLSVRFLYRNLTKEKQLKRKKIYLILSWIFLLFSGSILTLFVVLCFKGEF